MTEFSVGDRVLVPGVVQKIDDDDTPGAVTHQVQFAWGERQWFAAHDLRPDTGGRDLTAVDVREELDDVGLTDEARIRVAVALNRIARGDAGTRADDTAPPAEAPCQGSCVGCGAGEDQVCTGDCACVVSGVHDRDGYTPDCEEYRAAAGPRAGDTAVSGNEHGDDEHVSDHADHSNAPAGDTAPDDARPYECPDDCEDCQFVVNSLRAELDRLRSDAAALRAAGDYLFHVSGRLGVDSDELDDALTAWDTARGDAPQSAAGSPTTEGGDQT